MGWSKSLFGFFPPPYNGSSSAQLSLTSFQTILLDCIVTAVILACIFFKKKNKIDELLCSYFNIEDGRKYTTFLKNYAYYFKKGKNATETHKKRFVQCVEKVL